MAVSVGEKYNKLTVLKVNNCNDVLCQCECGKVVKTTAWRLTSGNTKSCGCYKLVALNKRITKHGLARHPLHKTWNNIKSRCYNPKATKYQYYGGKGVVVCDEWRDDFQKFFDWSIANGWRPGLTIDRINGDGDYAPQNCRWVDYKTQNNNLSCNHLITWNGETRSVYDWAFVLKMNPKTLSERLRRGWTIERAFSQAVQQRR